MVRVLTVAAVAALAGVAHGATFGFERISSNSSINVESQLSVELVDAGSGKVDVIFRNAVGVASNVATVYIDDGATGNTFASGSLHSQIGANFTFGTGTPPNLPGGNQASVNFQVTPGFIADMTGHPNNGLNAAADQLVLRFVLRDGKSFDDAVDAATDGLLRFGMHVRSIGTDGESDGFVTRGGDRPPIIPLPSAAGLGLFGLGLAATRRRR